MVMAVLMCTVWVVLFSLTVLAFWKGKIFYARDEDVLKDILSDDPEKEKEKEGESVSVKSEATMVWGALAGAHGSGGGQSHV